MNVSISLHWTPPRHFHGWERGAPRVYRPGGLSGTKAAGFPQLENFDFFYPSFLQKDAAEGCKRWLKPDGSQSRWKSSRAESVFSSCTSSWLGLRAWGQAAGASDTNAAAGWRVGKTVRSVFVGARREKLNSRTQTDASSRFYPGLITSTWLCFCFWATVGPEGAGCVLSGSGQSWPPPEDLAVICCWGFDPDSLHQIWNQSCVFASITVGCGAGMLSRDTGAIIRCRWILQKGKLTSNGQAERSRDFIHKRRKSFPTSRSWWEMWPLRSNVGSLSDS